MVSTRGTALVMVVLALFATESFAQRGSIRGKIVDANGNPIEGAKCVIEFSDGGRSSSAETKDDGQTLGSFLRLLRQSRPPSLPGLDSSR